MAMIDNDTFAERALMTAMTMNPLVALDRSQLVAAGGRVVARALASPRVLARSASALLAELGAVAAGRSTRMPDTGDRRFADPAFRDSPIYRRLMQGYLAWRHALHRLVDEVDLDSKSRERGRLRSGE